MLWLSLSLSVVMNKNKLSYSRHLLNPHPETALNVKDLGSVGRNSAGLYHNKDLIPLLDEEQLRTVPSTEEIWSRRDKDEYESDLECENESVSARE